MVLVLLKSGDSIESLKPIPIKSEDEFKQLIAKLLETHYQSILPEYSSDTKPLIIREFDTPSGRIDFLVLNSSAKEIYLLEVKKEDNYRVAVGQLFDYIAGIRSMPISDLIEALHRKAVYEDLTSILKEAKIILVAIMPEIGDRFRAVLDYLNDVNIKIYGIEIKKYATAGGAEFISVDVYPDPERPRTGRKVIQVDKKFDKAMMKLREIIERRLKIRDIVYYKTVKDLRLSRAGSNLVLARIYPRKKDMSMLFRLFCKDESGYRVQCFEIRVKVDDILGETRRLEELIAKIKQAYEKLYISY